MRIMKESMANRPCGRGMCPSSSEEEWRDWGRQLELVPAAVFTTPTEVVLQSTSSATTSTQKWLLPQPSSTSIVWTVQPIQWSETL